MRIALALLVAVACGRPASTTPPAAKRGGPGATCHCRQKDCVAVPCQDGLICGYGCGVPGCNSTCMTPEQHEQTPLIP